MKVITVNLLTSGAVAYLGPAGDWVDRLPDAALFDAEAGEAALKAALLRTTEITDAYLVDADDAHVFTGRDAIREEIRSKGPTVRADLGKQAEVAG